MKITPTPHIRSFRELKIEHGSQYIPWDTRAYELSTLNKDFDNLFRPLNDFMEERLTADEQAVIWNAYVEIFSIIKNGDGGLSLLGQVREHVAKIFTVITYEKVFSFVQDTTYFKYPPNLFSSYEQVEMNAHSKTYLRSHYSELIAFSIMCKALVPMFGKLVRIVKESVDNDKKEYVTMRITDNIPEFLENPATEKLRDYIHANFHKDAKDSNLIHAGIPSAEYDNYLFAHVIIKRIAVSSLLFEGESLVANIYNVLDKHPIAKGRKKSEFVKEKSVNDQRATDDGGDRAIRDGYKVKQKITSSIITEAEVWMSTYFDIKRIEPRVTQKLITRCHNNMKRVKRADMYEFKQVLIAAVLGSYVNTDAPGAYSGKLLHLRTIELVGRETALHYMAATQAILYTWGFELLAQLVTADVADTPIDTQILPSKAPSVRRMTPQPRERLNVLYTYHRKTPNNLGLKGTSPGEHTIHKFLTSLTSHTLYYNAPNVIKPEIEDITGRIHLPPVNDIRDELIDLILKVKTKG